jgi:choline dehydrogenase-like flavoprotein
MKKAIVVGSGAGGATVSKELQGHFEVTVLEAGKKFQPFSLDLRVPEKLKKIGLLFDERLIQLIFPITKIKKCDDRMILVNGIGYGGTTTISTGNALRKDENLKKIGIDLDDEFEEIYHEIPVTTDHYRLWRNPTQQLFKISQEMDLDPNPTPKMGNYERCRSCGRCVLGCPHGVKWDSRSFLLTAMDKGARLMSRCKVEEVVIEGNEARGVLARHRGRRKFFPADLVILAAGGLGTPVILKNSGIDCEPNLFVDPVLCVAVEWKGSHQNQEIPMPFVVQREHFILSPYFDHLSFIFNKHWNHPPQNILSMMIKLADNNIGDISKRKVKKSLTDQDKERLEEAVSICKEILLRQGAKKENMFLGTINAGHPGGMLPLSEKEARSVHNPRLPENLYVADATLLPKSLGNPPIFTIIALAKRVSKVCANLRA